MKKIVMMFVVVVQFCSMLRVDASKPYSETLTLHQDADGNTSLHLAAAQTGEEFFFVRDLNDNLSGCSFADIAVKNNAGFTALHLAAGSKNVKFITAVIYFITTSEAFVNPTILTSILLERNNDGDTPLHVAAIFGSVDVIQAILFKGIPKKVRTALLSALNYTGQTPRILALGYPEAQRLLAPATSSCLLL